MNSKLIPKETIKESSQPISSKPTVKTFKERMDEVFLNTDFGKKWYEATKRNNEVKDVPDFYMAFDNIDTKNAYNNVVKRIDNENIIGLVNKDSLIIHAHGTKDGKIYVGEQGKMSTKELGIYLQENDLIPENVKNIYTMSCYGGLQQPFVLENGVKIQSGHTSNNLIHATWNTKVSVYDLQDEAKIIPELEKYQAQAYSLVFDTKTFNQSRFINIDENGQYYLKNAKPEPIIKTPTEPEPIKNTNNELTPSFIDENGNIKEEYIIKKKLTPKEAFDKYGPDDDRFYTSQGLDPKVERKKVEKLNSKRKPVKTDKEILEDIAIKPEELDNFTKENEQLLKEINELKNNNTKTAKIESEKNVEEASEKATKAVQKATEKNVEEISEKVSEEVSEEITKELPKKKLSKSASEAINKIGDIKISKAGKIGLVAAALGGAYAIGSNKKDNKKEEKQQTPNYQTYVANTTQANYNNDLMYNSYAQQMAKDISSYRYGKQMTGFV